ncbi:MAG: hypothetical protein EXR27_04370 [Betaproteobacteria bacterium]|nr:hypothetical protein [Betaproteobacteria bacterium]
MRRLLLRMIALIALGFAQACFAQSGDYPIRPVRVAVGFAPHYAYLMPDSAQVDAMKAKLEQAEVKVDGPRVREPFHSIYFIDPSGYRMELTAMVPTASDRFKDDRDRSAEALTRWNAKKAERARAKVLAG